MAFSPKSEFKEAFTMKYSIKYNELSVEEFILLWETVWGQAPSLEQTRLAMEHTLFRVSIFDDNTIIAMARMIGDMGLDYYIKDSSRAAMKK